MGTILGIIFGAVIGLGFAFLEGGSFLLCMTYLPGEVSSPGAFRPLYDILHSHLVLCTLRHGFSSILVTLIGAFYPLSWLAAIDSALIYVPRFAALGAEIGLAMDVITFVSSRRMPTENKE